MRNVAIVSKIETENATDFIKKIAIVAA